MTAQFAQNAGQGTFRRRRRPRSPLETEEAGDHDR